MDVQGEDQLTEQLQQKQRSKILERLLEALAPDFNKIQEKVNEVFEQGRREGLDDMEIGSLVREQMKEHYSQATIKRVLPKSAKHTEFTKKELKMSSSERDPLELPPEVKVEGNFNTEGMGVAILEDDNEELSHIPQGQKLQVIDEISTLCNQVADLKQENKFLKDGLQHFKDENASLRKRLEEYQRLPNNDALYNQIDVLKQENKFLKVELMKK
jgi:hypothetical protein